MSQKSYNHVFVSNTGTLLASGKTVESLAVGQVAILDGNSHVATTTPTYANNKALELVWGTPDLGDLPLMAGVPNQNEYSKLIKGKKISDFKGFKAKRPRNEVWTVGWSGDANDDSTLFAKPGEVKHLYIKLTGTPIDKLYSRQGITRQFSAKAGVIDDCGDPCTDVDCRLIAEELVKAINSDPLIGTKHKLIKASTQVECTTPPTLDTEDCFKFKLTVCDTGDDAALGEVQSQYPDDVVKRIARVGASSVYEVVKDANEAPAAFSNAGVLVVPDCGTCPTGYDLVPDGLFVYKVTREDDGDATALTAIETDYGLDGDNDSASRINYEFGTSTYVVVSEDELAADGSDGLVFLGESRAFCVISDPTEISWESNGQLVKFGKTFRITIADDPCGTSRLSDLQDAYPDLTIAAVGEEGECVNTFETTVFSQCVEAGCSMDTLVFIKPDSFEGIDWVEDTTLDGSGCKCGIRLEVAFVNRITSECTFDSFPYEADTVHIQVSSFNPDYNASPDEAGWEIKKIQSYQHAVGFGAHVREKEKESKGYQLRERSFDPYVREVEGYQFITDPNKYYDEYILKFDFSYKTGGWSQSYTDSYNLHVYFPEGTGAAFESAINGYLSSANVGLDPVVL